MTILGITGGIGAGKSVVTEIFSTLGADVVDADKIAREIMNKGHDAYNEVVKEFGEDILDDNGNIIRKKLASIVFGDKNKLEALNKITHGYIFAEMNKQISSSIAELVCLDVPLLFASDFPIKCHKTLVVTADDEVRIHRVIKRDNCTKEQVQERMNKQLKQEDMVKLADFVIENNDEKLPVEKVKEIFFELTR